MHYVSGKCILISSLLCAQYLGGLKHLKLGYYVSNMTPTLEEVKFCYQSNLADVNAVMKRDARLPEGRMLLILEKAFVP